MRDHFFIDNPDGIPILTTNPNDPEIVRAATRQEVAIYADFWTVYLDRVEAGEPDSADVDEDVRQATLAKYGIRD